MEERGVLELDGLHDAARRVAAWSAVTAETLRARERHCSLKSKIQLIGKREGLFLDPAAISSDTWDTLLSPGVRRALRDYLHSPILIGLKIIVVPPMAEEQLWHADAKTAELHENANVIFTTDAVVPLTTLFELKPPRPFLANAASASCEEVRAGMKPLHSSCVMFDGSALHTGVANPFATENATRVIAEFYNEKLVTDNPLHLMELVEHNAHTPPPIKAWRMSDGDAGGLQDTPLYACRRAPPRGLHGRS